MRRERPATLRRHLRHRGEGDAGVAEGRGEDPEGRLSDARRGRQKFARYVEEQWLPHHQMEARTRENYTYYLDKHILPVFGTMRMIEILPVDVREWVTDLKNAGVSPTVIRYCLAILSAIFTTAFNDQITTLHPCRGVKTPPVPKKTRAIITPDQFDEIYAHSRTTPRGCWWRPTSRPGCAGANSSNSAPPTSTPPPACSPCPAS